MCLHEIIQGPDGELKVVDSFSGRRYPPDEEAIILAFAALGKKKQEKPQASSDQVHWPGYQRPSGVAGFLFQKIIYFFFNLSQS